MNGESVVFSTNQPTTSDSAVMPRELRTVPRLRTRKSRYWNGPVAAVGTFNMNANNREQDAGPSCAVAQDLPVRHPHLRVLGDLVPGIRVAVEPGKATVGYFEPDTVPFKEDVPDLHSRRKEYVVRHLDTLLRPRHLALSFLETWRADDLEGAIVAGL